MESISGNELIKLLVDDPEQWAAEFETIDSAATTEAWAQEIVATRLDLQFTYSGRMWARAPRYGFLPIGRRAIHDNVRLQSLSHRDGEALAAGVAIMPGDEYLFIPISGMVNDTHCELLFLTGETRTVFPNPVFVSNSGTAFRSSSTYTESKWTPSRVAYRLAGYLDDLEVQRLVTNASDWWKRFGGGEDLARRRGGRPPIDLAADIALRHWRDMQQENRDENIRPPTVKELSDRIYSEEGIDIRERTLQSRISKWKKEGEWE